MIVRDLLIKLGFQSDLKGLDKADRQVNQLKASTVALGGVLGELAGKGLQSAAAYMRDSAEASIEFGRGIANLSSIMGGTEADTQRMAEAAKELGKEFGVVPSEISAAMYDVVGSLGYGADTIAQTRAAVKLGRAGAATTAEAFNVLSKTTLAYGDTSEAAMKQVGDLASATIRLGVLTMPELSASLSQVTPLASSLGVSLEELFAVQAALSGPSGTASEVYTQMSSAMTGLLRKTTAMEGAFEKAFAKEGIKTTEEAMSKYGLQGTLEKLIGTTDGTQEQLVELFGRIEAVRFALAITGGQSDRYKEKLAELGTVTGEVDNAVRKQTTGMGAAAFALDRAKASAAAQAIEVGNKLSPAYLGMYEITGKIAELFGQNMIPMLTEGNSQMMTMGETVQGLEVIFQGLNVVLGLFLNGLDIIITSLKMVGTTIGALTGMVVSGDFSGLDALDKDLDTMANQSFSRMADRTRMMFGEKSRAQMMRDAQSGVLTYANETAAVADPLGMMGSQYQTTTNTTNVGAINVSVSIPPGSEGQSGAAIGDAVARALKAREGQNAKQGAPVQNPPVRPNI